MRGEIANGRRVWLTCLASLVALMVVAAPAAARPLPWNVGISAIDSVANRYVHDNEVADYNIAWQYAQRYSCQRWNRRKVSCWVWLHRYDNCSYAPGQVMNTWVTFQVVVWRNPGVYATRIYDWESAERYVCYAG